MRERSLRLGLLQVYQRRHSCVGGGGCQGLVAVGHSPTSTRSDPPISSITTAMTFGRFPFIERRLKFTELVARSSVHCLHLVQGFDDGAKLLEAADRRTGSGGGCSGSVELGFRRHQHCDPLARSAAQPATQRRYVWNRS